MGTPLVTIAIPTFNRSAPMKKAIESVLSQDYPDLEILVSDNASTDDTEAICREYAARDRRVTFVRQRTNIGAFANFVNLLQRATGTFFMWLGDDDWLDSDYVSSCLREFEADPTSSIVGGLARYYRADGQYAYSGRTIEFQQESRLRRVLSYYLRVRENGTFYGLMRKDALDRSRTANILGSDWLLMAAVLFSGKGRMLPTIHVHRTMGISTATVREIAHSSLICSEFQIRFLFLSVALHAAMDIAWRNPAYGGWPVPLRWFVGGLSFLAILLNRLWLAFDNLYELVRARCRG